MPGIRAGNSASVTQLMALRPVPVGRESRFAAVKMAEADAVAHLTTTRKQPAVAGCSGSAPMIRSPVGRMVDGDALSLRWRISSRCDATDPTGCLLDRVG